MWEFQERAKEERKKTEFTRMKEKLKQMWEVKTKAVSVVTGGLRALTPKLRE